MRKTSLLALLLLITSLSFAQRRRTKVLPEPESYTEAIVNRYTDSLSLLKNYYDSTWTYQRQNLLKDPYYFRLFFKPTLYSSTLRQMMGNDWIGRTNTISRPYSLLNTRDDALQLDSAMNHVLANFYVHYPEYIDIMDAELVQQEGIRKEASNTQPIKHEVVLAEQVKPTTVQEVVEPVKVVSHRPNFWKFTGVMSLSYMQNYTSNNWFQGRNNYNSMLATFYGTANYNNNDKVYFNNSLDAKLGFQTMHADTVHHVQSTTDQLRMINQFGLRAIKNIYYTMTLDSRTQMMPKYATNSHTIYSDFMSPFQSQLSVGMTWTPKTKFGFNASINPVSLDFKYVDRENLETRYGLKRRHHNYQTIGSSVTMNWQWNNIVKGVNWRARMLYFTNYERVQWEWENTFTMSINKYLNTTLYVYPRFDDTRKDEKGRYRIQLKQYLSVGFNYTFK